MKKVFCIIVTLVICSLYSYSQTYLGGANFVYYPGNQEPPVGWNMPSYDCSSWDSAYSVIGYGNSNDSTRIDTVQSLYLRVNFTIPDLAAVTKLNLMLDYDDGFIAYLNGKEVARVNLGDTGTFVPYNGLATRSREMVLCRNNCRPLMGYYLDSAILANKLVQGNNVFTIQLHNDSIKGSDLGIQFYLFDISGNDYSPYSWNNRAIKQVHVDSTQLPIVKIFTDEFGIENCDVKASAIMGIIQNSIGYNHYLDSSNVYWGNIGIEPRGQSSLDFPKKNYSVEFRDEDGNDTSIAILGMPAENDWVLHGPFVDRSLIRNALAYDLSNKIGEYAPRTRFCELFINNEYYGVYVLMERIKRDKDRVNIEKLPSTAMVNVTGGYIFKYDKNMSGAFDVVYPKAEDITPLQTSYINQFHTNYYRSLHDSVLLTERGYRKYIDVPSFINFTILNELFRNPDAYLYSTYMYKNSDDIDTKLHFGPIWDFDLAFSNCNFQNARSYIGWQFGQSTNYKLNHKKLFKDTLLVDQFNNRWQSLRNSVLSTDSVINTIDSLLAIIAPSVERNKEVWQLENNYIMSVWGQFISLTYDEDVALLKQWITNRAGWMDTNMPLIYYPYTYRPVSISSVDNSENQVIAYPNPCVESLLVKYSISKASDISIVLSSLNGVPVQQETMSVAYAGEYLHVFQVKDIPNGMYIVSVLQDGNLIYSQQIIKK